MKRIITSWGVVVIVLPFLFFVIDVADAASIDICVDKREGGVSSPLAGASVRCYDEDFGNGDDALTDIATTGSDGCVTLLYKKRSQTWYNPCAAWDCKLWIDVMCLRKAKESLKVFSFVALHFLRIDILSSGASPNPDIYCVVVKRGYFPLHTNTMTDQNQDAVTDFVVVTIFPERNEYNSLGSSNGCGKESMNWEGIPNAVTDFLTGFGDMCDNHDHCYSTCGETQHDCDDEFRAMMHSKCNDDWDSLSMQVACKSAADGMYDLVDRFGISSFESGQISSNC